MASIDISRVHTLGKEAARQCAERIAAKLGQELRASYHWQGDTLVFECPGASGRIRVGEDTVRVEIDLSFLLRPLRGHVEQEVRRHLEEALS